jgi:hypothetical protein
MSIVPRLRNSSLARNTEQVDSFSHCIRRSILARTMSPQCLTECIALHRASVVEFYTLRTQGRVPLVFTEARSRASTYLISNT